MQGTIVMLMALSGLGCHHKSCDIAYAPACYSGGCYGGCYGSSYETIVEPSCYSACYGTAYNGCYSGWGGCYGGGWDGCYGGCYGGGWDGCYGGGWGGHGGCYGGGRHGCGLFKGLFSCFGRRHHRSYDACCDFPVEYGCYATAYSGYSPAVFGSIMPIYETPMSTGQGYGSQGYGTPGPYSAPAAREMPANPAPTTPPAASATRPEETTAPVPPLTTPPPPTAVPPNPVTPPATAPKPPTPADAVNSLVKPRI